MILRDDTDPFWRNIYLFADHGCVEAEVIDNVHHFIVKVYHNGTRVTGVTAKAIRYPWLTCPGATPLLGELVGAVVADAGKASLDQTQQCTHMLDLARLAIAHANRGGRRVYECRVGLDPGSGKVLTTLNRDGEHLIELHLEAGRVTSQGPFHGHDTLGRSIWSDAVQADPDLREAGLIIRRAVFIYRSREYTRPRRCAADTADMEGACYSFQPERGRLAVRPPDFVEHSSPPPVI